MLVKRRQVAGMNALLNVVARYGEVVETDDEHVTIALGGAEYRFFIHSSDEQMLQRPLVLLASITAMTPHAVPEAVFYTQSRLLFLVDDDAASRITAAFDRFGQCVWCASYAHTGCAAQSPGEQCSCACRAEWAAVSAAQMAMQIMMRAPSVVEQPVGWDGPCLCVCQLNRGCGGCGHAGCAARRVQS